MSDEELDKTPDESLKLIQTLVDDYLQLDTLIAEAEGKVPTGTKKLDSDYAGYMELDGAQKNGDCKIVDVDGGVSKDKGCCNLFHPAAGAGKFSCGTCTYERDAN